MAFPVSDEIHLWVIDESSVDDVLLANYWSLLSADELQRHERLRLEGDRRRFIEQDVGLTSAQQFLGKFAMLVFLPFVVGQHADDRGATEADQTHLQVGHFHS